jgi:hypothetical protein
MFEGIFGALVSIAANLIYIDKKRKGVRGFGRICAFWFGTPVTWLWLFFLKEGTRPELEPPPDDVEGLLEEIRRDRALRAGEGEPLPELGPGDPAP